jgi:hypothetical protein
MPNFLFFIFETKDSYTKVNRNTKSRTKAEARRGDKGPEQDKSRSTKEGRNQKRHTEPEATYTKLPGRGRATYQ